MGTDKEQAESIIKMLLPKVQESITAMVEGKFSEKLPELKSAMQNELWDKAVEEIGKRMNLPADLIAKLQTIDDLVKSQESQIGLSLEKLISDVEAFKDRLKGVDLNKTITMSYKELQTVRIKSALSWALISFALGFFAGIVSYGKFVGF